ncbi:MAG TPA: NAD-dependent epimerase/dehydratase family protein [Polyangia bacterium]|nr:NAD-dependent epimerase/dehydratase family protein [Polyangia bacterium]
MERSSGFHVVLGTGALGLAVARALRRRELPVRMINRSGRIASPPAGADVVRGDLTDDAGAREITRDARVIYHCAAPAYTDWLQRFPPLQRAIVAAAAHAGARLVVAENLYGYGPVDGPLVETLPLAATGRKGRLRAALTEELLAAHAAGTVAVTIGRGSDFFGPHVAGSAVGDRFFRAALAGAPVDVLGDGDAAHSYTFIDDFGEALALLGQHDQALGRAWHVPNAPAVSNLRFAELAIEAAGSAARPRVVPRWLLRTLGLFNPPVRELLETLYQFERPFVADGGAFTKAFGFAATPLEESLAATVRWYRSAQKA